MVFCSSESEENDGNITTARYLDGELKMVCTSDCNVSLRKPALEQLAPSLLRDIFKRLSVYTAVKTQSSIEFQNSVSLHSMFFHEYT